jgi:hypothetical protein
MQILKNIAIGFLVLTIFAVACGAVAVVLHFATLKVIASILGIVLFLGLCYCIGISVTGE